MYTQAQYFIPDVGRTLKFSDFAPAVNGGATEVPGFDCDGAKLRITNSLGDVDAPKNSVLPAFLLS
jgi:hypothetical protein